MKENQIQFFEKLLIYKEDSIKAKKTDKDIESFYNGIIVGMTEAFSILYPEELLCKDRIKFKDEDGIKFLKAKINELKSK